LFLSTRGPWQWSEGGGAGFDRPNPATVITGSEGGGAWKLHQVCPHLQMPGIEVGVACSGGTTRAGGLAAEENGGGGDPASSGQGEGVGKLQGGVGKLDMGSIGVEEGRRWVLHGEQGAAAGGSPRQWRSGRN
jgi:hypothetical protein